MLLCISHQGTFFASEKEYDKDQKIDLNKFVYDYYRGFGNSLDAVVKYLWMHKDEKECDIYKEGRIARLRRIMRARAPKKTEVKEEFEKALVFGKKKLASKGKLEDALSKAIKDQEESSRKSREKRAQKFIDADGF